MSFATFSHAGTGRAPSRLADALQKFFDTWAETTAAYAAYRELRVKAPGDLAHQGLRRCEVARRAMGLPRLPRV